MLKYNLDISSKSYMRDYTTDRTVNSFCLQMMESGYFEAGPAYFTSRDNKDAALLIYTVSGSGILAFENRHFVLEANSAILFSCTEAHTYRAATPDNPWCFHWAHISIPSIAGYQELISDSPLSIRNQNCVKLNEVFFRIDELANRNDIFADGYRSGCVAQLLDIMLGAAEKEIGESLPKSAEITKVVQYIDLHLREQLNIDELAGICHVSKYHFIRLFRRCTGMSPYKYITVARINKSKILLTTTQMPVREIAEATGFLEFAHFSSVFKRITGVTPSVYRKEQYRL